MKIINSKDLIKRQIEKETDGERDRKRKRQIEKETDRERDR